jgi:hypothetical protein
VRARRPGIVLQRHRTSDHQIQHTQFEPCANSGCRSSIYRGCCRARNSLLGSQYPSDDVDQHYRKEHQDQKHQNRCIHSVTYGRIAVLTISLWICVGIHDNVIFQAGHQLDFDMSASCILAAQSLQLAISTIANLGTLTAKAIRRARHEHDRHDRMAPQIVQVMPRLIDSGIPDPLHQVTIRHLKSQSPVRNPPHADLRHRPTRGYGSRQDCSAKTASDRQATEYEVGIPLIFALGLRPSIAPSRAGNGLLIYQCQRSSGHRRGAG